eukprot:4313642-Pyramimonas_sp.AAC.1
MVLVMVGLAERCVPPTRAGKMAWVQLCKGKHPHYTRRKLGVSVDVDAFVECFNRPGFDEQ